MTVTSTAAAGATVTGDGANAEDRDAPLAGLRVVEISMYVQGPVAGLVLASLGADVIRIERVGTQDHMRTGTALYGVRLDDRGRDWVYAALNRGKRAVALDVGTPAGRPVFEELIRRADVFVTNLREDGLQQLGADPDTLLAINPSLIYARGGGFALRGPLASDGCQDTVGMAYGGFMDLASGTDEPTYPPGALSDVLTGTNLASAVLTGLVRRSLRGRGRGQVVSAGDVDAGDATAGAGSGGGTVVGTSQVQSLLWMQLLPVGMGASIGKRMPRFSRDATSNPLFSIYPTADGWLAMAAIHPHQWPPLAGALGLDHLVEDERFTSFESRARHRGELIAVLEETLAAGPASEWWEKLRAAGVWSSPVLRVEQVHGDPHVRSNEYVVDFPDGFAGPPAPFEVGEWRGARTTAAGYGEHTDEVLAELGLTEDEVVGLRVDGAVW
jgi:crotonobetainyl-CoA:carnitine CoA-transferase CaiB-like acyl-CoA transferase